MWREGIRDVNSIVVNFILMDFVAFILLIYFIDKKMYLEQANLNRESSWAGKWNVKNIIMC